jgi:NitT/TauT family transport system substrate-binding protein
MIDAVREGWRAYIRDPTKANEYMGKLNPTMDAETFKASAAAQQPLIETADAQGLGLGAMTLERWQTLVRQLVDLKVIDKPVDPQSCFLQSK